MAELTLTGATLTSDGPLIEMASTPASLGGQSHSHNHSHSHSHSHSGRPCCSSPAPVLVYPSIPNVPVEQVLTWEAPLIFKRLSEIARTGTYEAFDPILQGLKRKGKESMSEVLDRVGDDGPSLLHWAAKRGMCGCAM
jgi:hypothetical protein